MQFFFESVTIPYFKLFSTMSLSSTQQQRRHLIRTLYNVGNTKGMDICLWTNIPKQTVFHILTLIKDKKILMHRKKASRPSKIKPDDKKRIVAILKSNHKTSLRSILLRLSVNVSISTIHAQVKRQNFVNKRAVRVTALTDLHVSIILA